MRRLEEGNKMTKKAISKNQIDSFIKDLSKKYRIFSPKFKETDYQFIEYDPKENYTFPSFQNARIPPKELLFPRSEVLFSFKKNKDDIKIVEPQDDPKENIIFGIRNCDARGFKILDTFFASGHFKDNYYFNRRDKTIMVGFSCNNPLTTCFCTSVGGDPFSKEGFDIQVIELKDKFLFESISEKGEEILKYLKQGEEITDEYQKQIKELSTKSNESITVTLDTENIEKSLDNLFESKIWSEINRICLTCGSCTFICPTCHCFDVQDELDKDGGKRIRLWDTCQFELFTQETSGHNPRDAGFARTRQRLFHKFNYYMKNYDLIGCVGCGRCITNCPVNHDIRETLETVIQS